MSWIGYALCSALFAGITALLAKVGVGNVSSNLATLVRTVVVVLFATALVSATGEFRQVRSLTGRDWAALAGSGLATGISWLFYFAALKAGPISGVAPIDKLSFVIAMTLGFLILKEPVRPLTLAGAGLIVIGVLLTLPTVQEGLGRLFQ
jgi:transporter family protein